MKNDVEKNLPECMAILYRPIIEETDFKQYVTNKYSILNNVVNLEKLDAH